MLLNEFLKEHRKVQELEAKLAQQQENFQRAIAQQQKDCTARLKEQDSKIQRVIDLVEMNKGSLQVVRSEQ